MRTALSLDYINWLVPAFNLFDPVFLNYEALEDARRSMISRGSFGNF